MKLGLSFLAAVTLLGCSEDSAQRLPTAPGSTSQVGSLPVPTPTSPTSVWVMVVGDGGGCINDATVAVVGGQRAGLSVVQTTPCSVWDPYGGVVISDLSPGVEMTLRASAPGYAAGEQTVTPTRGQQMGLVMQLAKTQ